MPHLSRNQIPPLLAVLISLILCILSMRDADAQNETIYASPPQHPLVAGELAPDSYEPNDTCEQATTIEPNGTAQLHNFHHADDVDWFRIDVRAGARYHIAINATTGVAIRMVGACTPDGPLAAGTEAVAEPTASNASIIITAPANGQYHFSVGNNTPDATDTPTYRVTVRQQLGPDEIGAAIIVAGRLRANDPLQQNIHNVTDALYDLFRGYGYTDDQIHYLATDATLSCYDAAATRDNLREAITNWAVSRVSADRYLTLYMIDASDRELFLLDEPAGQRLTPDELDGWLTTVENAVPGLKINVILEHCYGATFIATPGSISRAGRLIITSTDVNELAFASPNGAYFSDTFVEALNTGRTLYDAFVSARDTTLSATAQRQHAQLDGDGDGVPGEPADEAVARNRVLFPAVGNVTPTVTPPATATPSPSATPSPTGRPSFTPSPPPTPTPTANATPTPTLTANPTAVQQAERGAIIIVAGRLNEGDEYQRNIHSVANRVYQIFRTHGYTDDDITYLATDATQPGYDGAVTVESLRQAITEWAVSHVGANQPLTLYLIDHGLQERFYLDNVHGEILTPTQLDSWLNEFEAAVPTATVNVILEACFIGSFIEQPESISKPGRVIIASSNSRWGAYLSPDGAYFSDYFLTALHQGRTLQASFVEARDNVNLAHGSYAQIPWLDANGNSRPNEEADFAVAAQRSFSYPGSLNEDRLPPVIDEVSVQGANAAQNGRLSAVVRDNTGISTVWAMIYPPSYTPPTGEQGLFAETAHRQPLISAGDNRYTIEEAHFTEIGTYHIVFHAQDGAGNVARPVRIAVAVGSRLYLPLVVQQ